MRVCNALLVAAGSLFVGTALPGQSFQYIPPTPVSTPVPTSLTSSHYGEFTSGNPSMPWVECDARGPRSALRLLGGNDGEGAILLVAPAPAAIPLAGGRTLLVGPSAVPIAGVIQNGQFEVPIDIVPELAGTTLYVQGATFGGAGPRPYELTWGMQMRMGPPQLQPDAVAGYTGPAISVLPCVDVSKFIPTMWGLRVEFDRPAAEYQVVVEDVSNGPGNTTVSLILRRNEMANPAVKAWTFVDLPLFPQPRIEVWVMEEQPGLPGCPMLAAVVQRDM